MNVPSRAGNYMLLAFFGPIALIAQEWTERQVVEKFLEQSPYSREARGRVQAAAAEAAGRTLPTNPSAVFAREGAGYAAFFQIEQQLPISGRRGFLRQAGAAATAVTEAESDGELWSIRMDLRLAFYRLAAAQDREAVLGDGMRDLESIVHVLRVREQEGEGSRYDRLRAERELSESGSHFALTHADVARARAALSAYLPPDGRPSRVAARLETIPRTPGLDVLVERALSHRSEYVAAQRQIERLRWEGRASGRLRFPEPIVTAGFKRGEVAPGRAETASAVGITIPIPLFNRGQTETARWRAEQDRTTARREALERRIRAEVLGALEALRLRREAVEQYRSEVNRIGPDLDRIARVAYQEGEIGILELLDSYRVTRQALLRLVDLEMLAKEAQLELDRAVGEEVMP